MLRPRWRPIVALPLALSACTNDFEALFAGAGGATSGPTGAGGATATATAATASASASATSTSTSTGSGGVGGSLPDGCSDGSREGYVDEPRIAACSGAFQVKGVTSADSKQPQCLRAAGNTGTNLNGAGCSVEDLCHAGFHVCLDSLEVEVRASTHECLTDATVAAPVFWLTRQHMDNTNCASGSKNNLVGCGSGLGEEPLNDMCEPLNRKMTAQQCAEAAPWSCGPDMADFDFEADEVVKPSNIKGGVLCCDD